MPAVSHLFQARHSARQLGIRQRSLRRHCRLGRATELVFVLATGVTLVLGGQAQAQTWDGQTNSNWGTATNWDNDLVPSSGDTIIISGAGGANQPILDANRTASQTNVTGGTLTLPARLDSPVTVTSLGNLVVTSVGRIQGATSFAGVSGSNAGTLGGTLSVSAGTFTNSGFVDGSTTVSGGILNLNASSNLSGAQGLIVNGGQVNVNANDTVGTLSGSGGTVTVNTGATLTTDVAVSGSYAGNIDGVGGFSKDGAGTTLTLSGANTHTGTMTVVRGTLALTGTTTTSVFNVGSGADLSSDGGGFAATTDVNLLGNNSSLILTGDDTIGALNIDNNADVTLTGATLTLNENSVLTGTITGTGGLTINGGTTSITNAKAYTGSTSVSGGSLSITGAGTVASTVVNLTNAGTLIIDAGALANPAAVSVGGSSTFTVNGANTVASLTQTGGTVDGNSTLTVNGAFDQSGGSTGGTVTVNAATFTQSGGGSVGFGTTVNASGLKTLNNGTIAGTLGGAGATTVQTGTTTLTGTINGAIDIAGAGRLTLGTGATLNGGLTLTSGTLHAADGATLSQAVINNGAGVISAAGGETLELATLNPNSATQLTIGESGQTGTVRVNNTTSQSASATIVVNAGTLQMGGSGAATNLLSGIAGTTVNTGATLDINGFDTLVDSLTGTGSVTNNGAAAVTLRLEGISNFGGAISNGTNATSVEVTSGNTATLSGNNTYTGTTTISAAGTLNISGGNAIDNAGAVAVNGGRLEVNADERIGTLSGTAAGVVDLNANDLTVGTSATTVYAGGVEGMAGSSLVKLGSGTQTINGTVNTAGAVVVQAGTLTLSGTNTITGGITVGGAGQPATLSLQSSGAAGGATGSITTLGSVVDYADTVNSATPITISSATTQLQVLAGSATQSGAVGQDVAGRPLEKIGAGTLTLSGTNTYTGATTVTAGTLIAANGAAIDNTSQVNVGTGATFQLANNETIGALSGAVGATVAVGANTLIIAQGSGNTFSGALTGTGNIDLRGNTSLTLTGASSGFTGTIGPGVLGPSTGTLTLAAGSTIAATTVGAGGGGTLVLSGGTLTAAGAGMFVGGTATINGSETVGAVSGVGASTINLNGATTVLTVNGTASPSLPTGVSTIASNIGGTGGLSITGGTTTLSGTNTYSGTTTVGTGATLNLSGGSAIADAGAVVVNGGTLALNASERIGTLDGTAAGIVNLNANDLTFGTAANGSYAGQVNGLAGSDLIKLGTGTQTLGGTINTAGAVRVQDGTLELGGTNTITGGIFVGVVGGTENARLRLLTSGAAGGATGSITTLGSVVSYANGTDIATPITLNSNDTQLEVLAADTATQSGAIGETGGARPIEKIGTGTLTLSGVNTYTGATTITAGTLIVNSLAALSDTAQVSVASGATLQLGSDESIGALSGDSGATLTTGSNALTILGAQTTTYAGTVSGAGSLVNDGSGSLTLTGDGSAFTGVLGAIGSGATVAITGAGTTGASGAGATAGNTFTTDGGALLNTAVVMAGDGQITLTGSETIGTLVNSASSGNAGGTVTLTGAATTLTINGSANPINPGNLNGTNGIIGGTGNLSITGGTFNVGAAGNVQVATSVAALGTVVNAGQMADITNAGTVTNNGIVGAVGNTGTFTNNLTAGAVTNSGSGTFTNAAAGTVASLASSATASNAGIVSGTLTVTGGTTTNTGTVSGATTVSAGTLEQDAGTLNGLAISGAAIVNADGGTVNGAKSLTGGTLNANGASFGATPIINDGGIINVTAATTGSVTNNIGSLNVNAGGILTGNVTNAATTTIASAGQVSGNVTNSSVLNLNGAITGAPAAGNLTNTGTVNANGAVSGNVANQAGAQFTLAPGATAGVGGTLTNASGATTTIGAGSNLTTGAFNNQAGATLANAGTLVGPLTNAGTVTATTGAFNGAVVNTGSITATTALNLGSSLNNQAAGTVNTVNLTVLGATTNTGSIAATGAASFAALTNSGALTAGTLSATGLTNNTSTISTAGNMNLTGGLTGGGTLNVVGAGDTSDVITVGGTGLTGGVTLQFDLDLSPVLPSTAGASDRLVMSPGAGLSGAVNLQFTLNGTGGEVDIDDLLVIDVDAAATNAFTLGAATGLPNSGGKFVYALDQLGVTNGDVYLRTFLNPGISGLAGNVTLTQSLIGSVINRPSSPFVSGLAYDDPDACGAGVWGRAIGGAAKTSGTTSDGSDVFSSTLDATYSGVQLGGDFACFNGYFNGWDLALGGIVGLNNGRVDQPVFAVDPTAPGGVSNIQTSTTTADFSQYYGGIYTAAVRGPLAIDLQYRVEKTDFDLTNTPIGGSSGLGLTGTAFSSKAQTLSGSVSYAYPIADTNLTVLPVAGFAWTKTKTDPIRFDNGDTLDVADFDNQTGFVGATLARSTFAEDGNSAFNQFITATYYSDFASDPRSTFNYTDPDTSTAQVDNLVNENLGAYTELSVGLNYVRILTPGQAIPARQLNASIRADARFGDQLNSWGLTGQLRLQF